MASQKIEKEQKGSAKQTLMSTRRPPQLSKDDLKHMVEEATVDAYGDSEQVCGFYTMLENDLQLPFNTVLVVQFYGPRFCGLRRSSIGRLHGRQQECESRWDLWASSSAR